MRLRRILGDTRYLVRLMVQLASDVKESDRQRAKQYATISRTDLINYCANAIKAKNYLEIGVRNPDHNFNHINVPNKTSVDPGIELDDNPVTHAMTSDEFFELFEKQSMSPFDLIFIDGLHLADQVRKDIYNAIASSTDDAIIILHDCNPPNPFFARENYYATNPAKGSWNGTTYKAAWEFAFVGNYEMRIVDSDMGVGIIDKSKKKASRENPNPYCEWNTFEHIRNESGLLVNFAEFKTWFNSGR